MHLRFKLHHIIPVLAMAGILVFGTLFARDYLAYQTAEEEYRTILDRYILKTDGIGIRGEYNTFTSSDDETPLPSFDGLRAPIPEKILLKMQKSIDFSGLQKVNPALSCVLSIPALKLWYPVVYSDDNQDYLNRTFQGIENASGAIFYDAFSKKNFASKNTFLFGHNMKNGTMFGVLKNFLQDDTLWEEDPYFYIFTGDAVRTYRIISYYTTTENSATYQDFSGEDGYDRYVKRILEWSVGSDDMKRSSTTFFEEHPERRAPLVTLSTCSGKAGGNQRFVVHGVEVRKS